MTLFSLFYSVTFYINGLSVEASKLSFGESEGGREGGIAPIDIRSVSFCSVPLFLFHFFFSIPLLEFQRTQCNHCHHNVVIILLYFYLYHIRIFKFFIRILEFSTTFSFSTKILPLSHQL